MKNNRIILIATVLLGLLALILIYTNKSGTIKGELKDFAIKDTGSITKIFLADKENQKALLVRNVNNDGYWTVNGKFLARKDCINTLLLTIASLEVQSPVAKAAYNSIVKDLAASGVKVEIYQGGDKPSKVFYVGGATQEQTGTFMLLQNSSMPFVMQIPGFEGYLSTRFFTSEANWKDHSVFRYKKGEIASVTYDYVGAPNSSFKIEKTGNKYQFLNFQTNKPEANIDTNKVNIFLNYFKMLAYQNEETPANKDSILKVGPYCVIKIVNTKGIEVDVPLFLKPNDAGKTMIGGKVSPHDVDCLYTTMDRGKSLALLQYHVFGDILRVAEEFKNGKVK